MRKFVRQLLWVSGMGILVLSFQNCTKHQFTNAETGEAKLSSGSEPQMNKAPLNTSCSQPSVSGLATDEIACFGWWDFGDAYGDDREMCTFVDPAKGGSTVKALGCQVYTKACASGVAVATRVVQTFEPWHDDKDGAELASPEDLALISEALKSNPADIQQNLITFWVYTCQDANAAANTEVLPAYSKPSSAEGLF